VILGGGAAGMPERLARADVSAGSASIHSPHGVYQLGTTFEFEVTGPSTDAHIEGPT